MTALLEYFKWTTQHQVVWFFCLFLPMPRGGGQLLVLSCYYRLIIKGCVPRARSLIGTDKVGVVNMV